MRLTKITLWITAMAFIGFGAGFLINPRMLESIGVALLTPSSRFEIRSFYGGMEIGIGVFFALAALREAWHRIALIAQVAIMGGLVGGRVISLIADGIPAQSLLFFFSLELAGFLLGVIALRRSV